MPPAETCLQGLPNGISHWPCVFPPQAYARPSLDRTTVWYQPQETCTSRWLRRRKGSNSHWPYLLEPTSTTEPRKADNTTATEGRLGNHPSVYKEQKDTRLDLCTFRRRWCCLSPECHRCEEALCDTQQQRPACSRQVATSGCCTGHNDYCREPQLRPIGQAIPCASFRTQHYAQSAHIVEATCTGHAHCRR